MSDISAGDGEFLAGQSQVAEVAMDPDAAVGKLLPLRRYDAADIGTKEAEVERVRTNIPPKLLGKLALGDLGEFHSRTGIGREDPQAVYDELLARRSNRT